MNSIEKYEKFFDYDLKIKKILYECVFDPKYSYNEETVMAFSEMLEDKIEEIEYYMDYIITLFYNGRNEDLKNLINNCKQKLINCGSDWVKIKNFIEKNITGMREELVDEVGKNSFLAGMGVPLSKAISLNEALHIIHTSIVNCDERYILPIELKSKDRYDWYTYNNFDDFYNKKYGDMPLLQSKNNFEGEDLKLYGRDNQISKSIFDAIPFELDFGPTEILSFNNKILIMVSDRGHALSIEITVENDKCFVEYYIPKICNVDMVNNLIGVNKVDKSSKFTTGRFETNTIDIGKNIANFISKVPTDADIISNIDYLNYQEESHKTL